MQLFFLFSENENYSNECNVFFRKNNDFNYLNIRIPINTELIILSRVNVIFSRNSSFFSFESRRFEQKS